MSADSNYQTIPAPRGDPRYRALLDEMWDLHCTKSYDYGDRGEDPLDNLHASIDLGVKPSVAVLIRAGDKWRRIKNWVKHADLALDSVDDDLRDMSAYLNLARLLMKEEEDEMKKARREEAGLDQIYDVRNDRFVSNL